MGWVSESTGRVSNRVRHSNPELGSGLKHPPNIVHRKEKLFVIQMLKEIVG